MPAESILQEFLSFCREAGLAESTFGRLAVNDGKLISRLRDGGSVTTATLERVHTFMRDYRRTRAAGGHVPGRRNGEAAGAAGAVAEADGGNHFRFFDNRQKYLLFVNTCSEKRVVGNRVAAELAHIQPQPPAIRLFDAGMGDGTVLARVMRAMHDRFPHLPFYISGKEISLEDVRLTLDRMADRFYEHPSTVLVLTNLYYAEAPWLAPRNPAAAQSMIWREVALSGDTAARFEEQITDLHAFLSEVWHARTSPVTGNPVYERPVVLVIYRHDHRFLLDPVIPRPGQVKAEFDLVIASQPYRARASDRFKAGQVLAPLVRALGRGGRLIGIHSCGGDPGLELVQKVWQGENPFHTSRHSLLKALRHELGGEAGEFTFSAGADARSVFRYDMHTLPDELSGEIGTSTLFAAWNAAIYVAQVEDQRLQAAVKDDYYLEATDQVLKKYRALWFNDESYVVSRRR